MAITTEHLRQYEAMHNGAIEAYLANDIDKDELLEQLNTARGIIGASAYTSAAWWYIIGELDFQKEFQS